MKKSDLKTGMIVETRNGDRYLVMRDPNVKGRDLIRFGGSFMPLKNYDEDLRYSKDEFTIDKIYSAGITIAHLLKDTDRMDLELIWERPKPILDEVEKEYLGAVIKPFRRSIQSIMKRYSIKAKAEEILISYTDMVMDEVWFCLPHFPQGTMYKGMELCREYSLEELGL